MPLHLLGKKSWNVYNQENIDRVQRDEAAAKLREKDRQRRADEADAESRLQILRGSEQGSNFRNDGHGQANEERRSAKKRKLDGENETDWEMRLAQQALISTHATSSRSHSLQLSLTGTDGHINLFPENDGSKSRKNDENVAEIAKKKQDLEDQYTMRFAHAAGKHQSSDQPWYNRQNGGSPTQKAKGALLNQRESLQQEREKKRLDTNDPLAIMKKGVKQLREAEKHREDWRAQRERDLGEVEVLARKNKHARKRHRSDEDSLDGFNLDEGCEKDRPEQHKKSRASKGQHRNHRHNSRSHPRHRRRSRERET